MHALGPSWPGCWSVRGKLLPLVFQVPFLVVPATQACGLLDRFSACASVDDALPIVKSVLRDGAVERLVRAIPSGRDVKADCVFYLCWGTKFELTAAEMGALQRAITDELFRRPALAKKLARASQSLYFWGRIMHDYHDSFAAAIMNETLTTGLYYHDGASSVKGEVGSEQEEPYDWEILHFFITWSLLAEPISVEGITRKNFYSYLAKLGAWWQKTRPRLSYDPRSRRVLIGGPPRSSPEESENATLRIKLQMDIPPVPYHVLDDGGRHESPW